MAHSVGVRFIFALSAGAIERGATVFSTAEAKLQKRDITIFAFARHSRRWKKSVSRSPHVPTVNKQATEKGKRNRSKARNYFIVEDTLF